MIKQTKTILAFGDSLTYGFGVTYELSYPRLMEKKAAIKVINAGVNGEFTTQGLRRLPLFLREKPDYVILCHGVNDIYNGYSVQETKANILAMIKLIEESGSKTLLVGVPEFGTLDDEIHSLYYDIAEESDVLFEENILRRVLSSNRTKVDDVHPNADGYEMMASAFIEILEL